VLHLFDLPYPSDCARLFAPLANTPWAMWLDGGNAALAERGRDIMVAFPRWTLETHAEGTHVTDAQGHVAVRTDDPLDVLADTLARLKGTASPAASLSGGAVGYFAYDLGRRWMSLPSKTVDAESIPDMAVGMFDGMLVVDHAKQTCQLRAQHTEAGRQWLQRMREALSSHLDNAANAENVALPAFSLQDDLRSNMSFDDYAKAFSAVQQFIREGDCYQVNLAMRFAAPCQGHPWHAYVALRQRNPAPFSAWLNFPFAQVLSTSPESFLQVLARQVATHPIKGTRPRGDTPEADTRLAEELAQCSKDRAENLMIVDLLRNDLGKVCEPGSVKTPALFRVEHYATVHHLVSTVTGQLAAPYSELDLLRAAFPGGSITGAPKYRAMQIIESLEPHRRDLYCGAIGYLDAADGGMTLNIAIRTAVVSQGEVRYWAGGGLVADSNVQDEYQECLDKGRALHEVLASFRQMD
jgi:para-aminobenzoate synthetase component 1